MISTALKTASSPKSQTRMTKITYAFPIASTKKILAVFLLAGSQQTLLITSTIRVGCSEAELKEKYPETGASALRYHPPEPSYSDFSTFYTSITYSETNVVDTTYSMSAAHNGSVSDMSFFAY